MELLKKLESIASDEPTETMIERWWRWKYERAVTKVTMQKQELHKLYSQVKDLQNQVLARHEHSSNLGQVVSHLGTVLTKRRLANSRLQQDYEAIIEWNKHQAAAIRDLSQAKADFESLIPLLDKLLVKYDTENRRLRLKEAEYEKKIIDLEIKLQEAQGFIHDPDFLEHP